MRRSLSNLSVVCENEKQKIATNIATRFVFNTKLDFQQIAFITKHLCAYQRFWMHTFKPIIKNYT